MKVLIMARAYRSEGQRIALAVITNATQPREWDDRVVVRLSDIMVTRAPETQVFLFDEGEGPRLQRIAEAINAKIVTVPLDDFVSTCRRESVIPEGWPRPLW